MFINIFVYIVFSSSYSKYNIILIMTGEEYYNLKQGDRVIVTKSTPTFLGMKGTIYEMVYRDH